jgi:hypothetical protein
LANTTFKLRRSSVAGKQPNTSTLSIGELGINLTDRKLYSSDGTNIFETGSNLTSLSVFSDITVGNSSVNTVVNSSSITVKSIIANGDIGTANQVLASNGSEIYWTNPQGAGGTQLIKQQYTGDGTTTSFTVTGGYVSNNLQVYLNGVLLRTGTEANVESGSAFTISPAPANNALIDIYGVSTLYSNGVSSVVSQQFTANGTSNSFTITSGYLPNQIQVYLNGVKQIPGTDVVVSSGNTVNFTITPANGYIVDVFGYQTSVSYYSNNLIVGNVNIGTDTISVGNSTVNTQIVAGNVFLNGSTLVIGNTAANVTVNNTVIAVGTTTINSTVFSGTSNNTSFVGSIAAANVVSNAQLSSNLSSYQTTAGLSGNVATLTANNANFVKANNGITSNSSGVFVTQGTGAVVNATGVHVNSSYIATISSNAAAFLTGNSVTTNSTVLSVGSNVTINTSSLLIGNSTVNTTISNGNISINGNNISPVQSFRNKIINGNFDIWQRTTSTSTSGYNADRWITNNTGSTFTSSRQSFTLGQTSVPYEPTYWHRTVVTTSAGASNGVVVRQCMESVRTLAGQTATLSFWAKADASKNISVEFSQIFGTGGSPSSTVTTIGVTTCALTTSFQKFTITVNIPSISGKTLGSNNDDYLELRFWLDAGSSFNSRTNSLGQQSGTFDIAQVQLEAGSVATPFEMRPMQTELALCQRYYEKSYSQGTNPGTITTPFSGSIWLASDAGSIGTTLLFRVIKRNSPTITIYNPSTGTSGMVRDATNAADVSASATDISTSGFGRCTGTFTTARMYSADWTSSAEY